jgi:hypothetical protein
MRKRAFLYILVGVASLFLATRTFLNAAYFAWRTVAPVPTGYRGHTRQPTTEESRHFSDRANRQLVYSALGLFISVGTFVGFGLEWRRARRRRRAVEVGSGTGAVVYRMPLGCVRRFRLRARLEVPSLRLRPPPHRTGQADFPHPAHREGVFHRGYASVQLGHAFALQYTTR